MGAKLDLSCVTDIKLGSYLRSKYQTLFFAVAHIRKTSYFNSRKVTFASGPFGTIDLRKARYYYCVLGPII